MGNDETRMPIGMAEAVQTANPTGKCHSANPEARAQEIGCDQPRPNSKLGFFLGVNEEVQRLVYGITPKGIFYGNWWISPSLNSATRAIVIESPSWKVFNYLSAPDNLKEWAVSGIVGGVVDPNGWLDVMTSTGPAMMSLRIDPTFGVVDFKAIRSNQAWYFATRVLTNNDQSCEFVVTVFSPMPFGSKLFDSTIAFVDQKIDVLKEFIEGRG